MSTLTTVIVNLADTPPADVDPTTGQGPEWGKAEPIGLLIILLMGIALFFLLRSMTRKIKNVPASFEPVADQGQPSVPPVVDPPAGQAPPVQHALTDPGGSGLVDKRPG